ncbi:DUF6290 family protein [Acidaminococcus fermentans]|uniref:DUF6290 family protein n=1 Tax=Acidaminococcus fermentans TaxID=905 RepID=UPI00241C2014|nr:plasmid mobilization relaxosome protein MobC [Acidaminococcus fermentans]
MREKIITIRLNDEEYSLVDMQAGLQNLSLSAFIRKQITAPIQEEKGEVNRNLEELRRIGINLNQIARKMNQSGCSSEDVQAVLMAIKMINENRKELWQEHQLIFEKIKKISQELHAIRQENQQVLNLKKEIERNKKELEIIKRIRRCNHGHTQSPVQQQKPAGHSAVPATATKDPA